MEMVITCCWDDHHSSLSFVNETAGLKHMGTNSEMDVTLTIADRMLKSALTHLLLDKMATILQMISPVAFLWMKSFVFWLKFHWRLFLRVQLTIYQHWFRKWLDTDQATSHYLSQWWWIYWRIYASLGLNELTHWPLGDLEIILQMYFWNLF